MPTGVYISKNRRGGVKGRSGVYPHKPNQGFQKGYSYRKGVTVSEETRRKISIANRNIPKRFGADSNNWQGGITPINMLIRSSAEMNLWRKAIFERDDYRCLDCGEGGRRLEADHIYRFSEYPRLRFQVENGQALC